MSGETEDQFYRIATMIERARDKGLALKPQPRGADDRWRYVCATDDDGTYLRVDDYWASLTVVGAPREDDFYRDLLPGYVLNMKRVLEVAERPERLGHFTIYRYMEADAAQRQELRYWSMRDGVYWPPGESFWPYDYYFAYRADGSLYLTKEEATERGLFAVPDKPHWWGRWTSGDTLFMELVAKRR